MYADVSTGFDYQYEISYAASDAKGYIFMKTCDDETEVTWTEVVDVDVKPRKG